MRSRRLPSRDLLHRAASTDLTTTRRHLLADGFSDAMIRDRVRAGSGVPSARGSTGSPPTRWPGTTTRWLPAWRTARTRRSAAGPRRTHGGWWTAHRRLSPYVFRALLRDILDEANGARSVLEYRYRRDCERAHGLPVGELQAAIRSGAVHDVAYREYLTLVELDGARYHSGTARFRDMKRDNKSSVQGFMTLRYGWSDVVIRPCEVAAEVAQVLQAHGWQGSLRRCRKCAEARG